MSTDSIIVMVLSMLALWGVAISALVYSMRKEDVKLQLVQKQNGFESFSPKAQRDLELWLKEKGTSSGAPEIRELLSLQKEALLKYPEHFYDWSEPSAK